MVNLEIDFTQLILAGCPIIMNKTVLVVEDESLSRTIIMATLKAHGLYCIEAENGKEALDLLNEVECELILTDLRMPVMNGLDFIKVIRDGIHSPKICPDIPIIVLSAEEGEMVDAAVALGISGYFIKKEPVDVLVPKLKELLGLKN